jgi:transposase
MGIQGMKKGVKMINEIKKYRDRGLNISEIARVLKTSRNTVKKYLKQGAHEGSAKAYQAPWSSQVNWAHVLREESLGVQLAHYWEQNIESVIEGVSYISFWREFRRRHPNIKLDMHQAFTPGERCEFDYKGKDSGFGYVTPETGEFIQCRMFGMVLPSSQIFFARATLTEKQEDVFNSITQGFKYFGGVTSTIVFDNAKAQVTRADNYDPDINSEFSLFCDSYDLAPIAARPSRPKDKSLIENSLGVFWRWAWPQLRKQQIFSLAELNTELKRLLFLFNNRVQKKYGQSRRQKFESYEKGKLKALPEKPYEAGTWKKVKVHPDCHVQVNFNYYSVPYKHRGKELNARVSRQCLEIYSNLERVAIHRISLNNRGRHFTIKAHLPEAHQALLEATPQSILKESAALGESIKKVSERLIKEARHPFTYLRRLQGILRLKKRYSTSALEEACLFFVDAPLADIKINNIERVISAKSKEVKVKKVERKENENLRGQLHWAEIYH